jgi:small GTP-binding protein
MRRISKKVAVVGNHAVGKTSLISRFVHKLFPESYLTTLGLKVDKKSIELENCIVDMILWDLAGQETTANIPEFYLSGCSGIIYVVDVSRPNTYLNLKAQVSMLEKIVPGVRIVVAANKKDLLLEDEFDQVIGEIPVGPDAIVSAKTGDSVEDMFVQLAIKLAGHGT